TSFAETAQFRQAVIAARPGSLTAKILGDPGIQPRVVSVLPATCAELSGDVNNGCAVVSGGLDLGSLTGSTGTYVQFFNTGGAPTGGGLDGIPDIQKVLLSNPTTFRGNQYNTRVDWNVTAKDTFTASTYFVPNKATSADTSGQSRPMGDIHSNRLSYALGFIYRRLISPTKLNEARFNITRWG